MGHLFALWPVLPHSSHIARGFRSRAVASVVALRFESAFAIGALVFWTREAQSAFVSLAAAFAAFGMSIFGC